MSVLVLPEIPLTPVTLVDDTKSEGETDFTDLFFMGAPKVVAIDGAPPWMDDDLKQFVAVQSKTERFHLVYIGCDFRPRDDARVTRAWINISLNRSDGLAPKPLCWSMFPLKDSDPIKTNRSAELSANAQLVGLKITAGEEGTREEAYHSAHGLGGSNPYWDLQERSGHPLNSQVLLKLVVSVPAGVEGNAMVVVDTAVTHGKFLRSRRAKFSGTAMDSVILKRG